MSGGMSDCVWGSLGVGRGTVDDLVPRPVTYALQTAVAVVVVEENGKFYLQFRNLLGLKLI